MNGQHRGMLSVRIILSAYPSHNLVSETFFFPSLTHAEMPTFAVCACVCVCVCACVCVCVCVCARARVGAWMSSRSGVNANQWEQLKTMQLRNKNWDSVKGIKAIEISFRYYWRHICVVLFNGLNEGKLFKNDFVTYDGLNCQTLTRRLQWNQLKTFPVRN